MMFRTRNRFLAGTLALGLALVAVVGAPAPAYAHNSLVATGPEDGATVGEGPSEVWLEFLLPLDPENTDLSVTGPDGEPVGVGEPYVTGGVVALQIDADAVGEYQATYEVLSPDGDLVDGTLAFTVTGEPDPAEPSPPAAAEPSPAPATQAPAADAASDGSASGPAWWLWVVAAAVLAGAAYGVYRWRRTVA